MTDEQLEQANEIIDGVRRCAVKAKKKGYRHIQPLYDLFNVSKEEREEVARYIIDQLCNKNNINTLTPLPKVGVKFTSPSTIVVAVLLYTEKETQSWQQSKKA